MDAAREGQRSGGTGFLVGVLYGVQPADVRRRAAHVYAVTNAHVAQEAPILRLMRLDGTAEAIPLTQRDWTYHANGDDVAVHYVDLPGDVYRLAAITTDLFVTRPDFDDRPDSAGIGIGDDVAFIGRFGHHDGRERNEPSIRFGNISLIPREPIQQENGHPQQSILVEARSMPGYSGSPVFFVEQHALNRRVVLPQFDLKLLGMDWGHVPYWHKVMMPDHETPHREGLAVNFNAGMMGVVPAWQITELLDDPRVREPREAREAALLAEQAERERQDRNRNRRRATKKGGRP